MTHAKHIRFTFAIALLVVLIMSLVPFAAFAQSSAGSISGNAVDDSGAALPGVTVTATNTATNATRTTTTNSTGHYELAFLVPGTYAVAAELSGFQPLKFAKVVVNVGSATTLDL